MEVLVQLRLLEELRVLGVHGLQLNCHLHVGLQIDALEDLAEGPVAQALHQLEGPADSKVQLHVNSCYSSLIFKSFENLFPSVIGDFTVAAMAGGLGGVGAGVLI